MLEIVEGELMVSERLLKEVLEGRSLPPVMVGMGDGIKLWKHADDSGLGPTSVRSCSAFGEEMNDPKDGKNKNRI